MTVSIPLITAPKTDTAEAQGDWTWLAHQSNPDQHDGRNNEVWGFGYNVDDTWSSRNGLDDGFSSRIETHYYPSPDIGPQMEIHVVGISKAAGGEFRPLSFFVQKAGSVNPSPYFTAGAVTADQFTISRPSDNLDTFHFDTHNNSATSGTFFMNEALLQMRQDAANQHTFIVFNQDNSSFDIVLQWQKDGASKWVTSVRTASSNDFWFYDQVADAQHTTLFSNGGMSVTKGLRVGSSSAAPTDGGIVANSIRGTAVAFASLPAYPVEGMLVPVTDSNTDTWGATISGGGSNHVLAYYNGTNWTVAAK
jgi:hypothetical protein